MSRYVGLALALLLVASAAWASEIGLKGIEGRVGFVSISEEGAGSTFGLGLGLDLGDLTEDLRLEGGLDFWSKTWDEATYEWKWTNIAFLGNVRYDFKTQSSFHPFTYGGLAICYQKWSWEIDGCEGTIWDDLCDYDDSSMEFGVNLGVGADFGSGDGMTPTVRVGYNGNGGADYIFVQGGLRFPMGQ